PAVHDHEPADAPASGGPGLKRAGGKLARLRKIRPMKEETMSLTRNTIAAAAMLAALALSAHARAADDPCKLEISGNDLMQYDKTQLSAPATCKEITRNRN